MTSAWRKTAFALESEIATRKVLEKDEDHNVDLSGRRARHVR